MSAQKQIVKINLPSGLDETDKENIGEAIAEKMRRNAENGFGAPPGQKGIISSYKNFPGYSLAYAKSMNFKIGGKSKSDVNLTLSGDMLASLQVLDTGSASVTLGFNDKLENAKADGNIRGTYGKQRANSLKARNFLGISKIDYERIVKKYVSSK